MVNKNAGRPIGVPSARAALLSVTQEHLRRGDLDGTTSRALANEAGVSHSLVNYHFGSRSALIAAAIGLTVAPHDLIAHARDRVTGKIRPDRLVSGLLAVWENPVTGQVLVRSAREYSAQASSAELIASYLQDSVFAPLASDFGIARARRMIASIIGFLFARYVLEVPTFTSLGRAEAAEALRVMLRAEVVRRQ